MCFFRRIRSRPKFTLGARQSDTESSRGHVVGGGSNGCAQLIVTHDAEELGLHFACARRRCPTGTSVVVTATCSSGRPSDVAMALSRLSASVACSWTSWWCRLSSCENWIVDTALWATPAVAVSASCTSGTALQQVLHSIATDTTCAARMAKVCCIRLVREEARGYDVARVRATQRTAHTHTATLTATHTASGRRHAQGSKGCTRSIPISEISLYRYYR